MSHNSIRDSYELMALYPHRDTFRSFASIKKRTVPQNKNNECVSSRVFERIIGEAVHDAILKLCSPEEAIDRIHDELSQLLE